jgi:hypothetical protein
MTKAARPSRSMQARGYVRMQRSIDHENRRIRQA